MIALNRQHAIAFLPFPHTCDNLALPIIVAKHITTENQFVEFFSGQALCQGSECILVAMQIRKSSDNHDKPLATDAIISGNEQRGL